LDGEYTGHVYYDGQDMSDVPPKDRYIGMVFQNYALYPHFPGRGNLSFTFKVRRAPDTETEERIKATAEIMGFGFSQLLERRPGTLSGGQQQRLAIGRALVRNPRLFLFDEPLSNLDARLRTQTRVEIKRLLRRFRITALYVTHDQEEAISLGDQLAVMQAGRIVQVGAFTELRDDPANAFVAGFLGRPPMNLIEGRVAAAGTLLVGESSVPLPDWLRERCAPGQTLQLGIRPEAAWAGHPDQPGPSGIHVAGTVDLVEPDYGQRTQALYVTAGGSLLTIIGPLDPAVHNGSPVVVTLPIEALYFFNGTGGERLRAPAEA
jgi:ABC-type sugar transport system ATPase subunit